MLGCYVNIYAPVPSTWTWALPCVQGDSFLQVCAYLVVSFSKLKKCMFMFLLHAVNNAMLVARALPHKHMSSFREQPIT